MTINASNFPRFMERSEQRGGAGVELNVGGFAPFGQVGHAILYKPARACIRVQNCPGEFLTRTSVTLYCESRVVVAEQSTDLVAANQLLYCWMGKNCCEEEKFDIERN